jgi:GNAT superfamily N-acetyltransferase
MWVVQSPDCVAQMAHMQIQMAMETEHRQLDADTVTKGIQAMADNPQLGFYLGAYSTDNQLVGMCAVTYEWSDWRNGRFWWIQSVYVLPQYRAQGVFKTLYNHIESMAKEDSACCGIRLYMEKDNHRARQVYQKLGLRTTEYDLLEKDFVYC